MKALVYAGFTFRKGKGSHRNYRHPPGINITINVRLNSDALPYQESGTKKAIEGAINEERK